MAMPDLGLLSRQGYTFKENDSVHSTIDIKTTMFTQLISGQRLFKWRKGLTHLMVSMKWTQQDIFFKSLSDSVKNFDLDEEKNKVLISESRIWKLIKRNLTF